MKTRETRRVTIPNCYLNFLLSQALVEDIFSSKTYASTFPAFQFGLLNLLSYEKCWETNTKRYCSTNYHILEYFPHKKIIC